MLDFAHNNIEQSIPMNRNEYPRKGMTAGHEDAEISTRSPFTAFVAAGVAWQVNLHGKGRHV